MEDLKWLLRRCGLPILLLLILVIAGVFCWGKMHAEKQKVAEEVWEPPVEISWMEYGRIIILISLFGIWLWSSHLKTEYSGIFLTL